MADAIVTHAEIRKYDLSKLEEFPGNPREISPTALAGLSESLTELTLLEMPIINVFGGKQRIVGGHQRVKALRAQGVKFADCVTVEFDDAEEMAANLVLNNPAIRGDFDPRKAMPTLDALLAQLPKPGFMGFDVLAKELREQAERLGSLVPTQAQDATAGTDTKDLPDSKPGKVYQLGKHRLYCGGFNDADSFKLFGKKRAQACVTDPPYNVAYEQAVTGVTIANDDLTDEAWSDFLAGLCSLIVGRVDGPCYLFMSSKEIPSLQAAWETAGGAAPRWLVWAKDRFTLSRGDYHHAYEPVMYGARQGVALALPATPRTNVLEFAKPHVNALHPTQKPVELIRALVEDASTQGQIVFDPFVGSGTTLVVCEELGRICYACEQSPAYCDVVRKRWSEQMQGVGDWRKNTPPIKKGG